MSALPPIATLIAFFGVSALANCGHGDLRERFADDQTTLDRLMIVQAQNQQ
jgi:hypothetical protein